MSTFKPGDLVMLGFHQTGDGGSLIAFRHDNVPDSDTLRAHRIGHLGWPEIILLVEQEERADGLIRLELMTDGRLGVQFTHAYTWESWQPHFHSHMVSLRAAYRGSVVQVDPDADALAEVLG